MKDYLKMLRDDIHTTVMATVDGKGHPGFITGGEKPADARKKTERTKKYG